MYVVIAAVALQPSFPPYCIRSTGIHYILELSIEEESPHDFRRDNSLFLPSCVLLMLAQVKRNREVYSTSHLLIRAGHLFIRPPMESKKVIYSIWLLECFNLGNSNICLSGLKVFPILNSEYSLFIASKSMLFSECTKFFGKKLIQCMKEL